jgi:hypothetical protein
MPALALASRPPRVTLDEDRHVYTHVDGHHPPSVTTILGGVPPWLGLYDQVRPDVLAKKAGLGQAVHLATWLADEDDLDEASVEAVVAPYLAAWRRFRAELGFAPVERERPVFHPHLGYAGCPDAVGHTPTLPRPVLVDIKTTAEPAAVLAGPQTAAYAEAWLAERGETGLLERWSVHLRDDGAYRLVTHRDRQDFAVFKAALEIWNFVHHR